MAPGYRNSNRRPNRTGYVDHDVFEGLPVRQWRRDYVTVAPPTAQENTTSQNDIWAVELPHGMPKDSHLLPQHSQDLLRAARSGRIYKRPPPVEEEEADPEAILGDKPEKKDEDPKDKGFTAKAWKQVPRHMEVTDIEYLAKRRKGLVTMSSKAAAGPTMMKTKVRREDAAGNEYTEDIIVPKGAQVQGEVLAQTVVADSTVADGFAHPSPIKRKGAPPKKKKQKGPGRGRKKNPIAPTSVPAQIDGVAQSVEGVQTVGPDGVKIENDENESSVLPTTNEDTEMADGSMAASDDDGGEDGEDGDEGDDDEGSVSAQDSPSKPPRPFSPGIGDLPHMQEPPSSGSPDTDMSEMEDLPGPPLPKLQTIEGEKSGSPLKNLAMISSNLTSPVKSQAPILDSAPPQESTPDTTYHTSEAYPAPLDEVMQQQAAETAPTTLPPPPPEPTIAEAISSTEVLQEEEEEEEMLLDIVENTSNANIGAPQDLEVPVSSAAEPSTEAIVQTQEPEVPIQALDIKHDESEPPAIGELPDTQRSEIMEPSAKEKDVALAEEPAVEVREQPVEADEPFTDLLGGLERQVEEPDAEPAPAVDVEVEPVAEMTEPVGEEKPEEENGKIEGA